MKIPATLGILCAFTGLVGCSQKADNSFSSADVTNNPPRAGIDMTNRFFTPTSRDTNAPSSIYSGDTNRPMQPDNTKVNIRDRGGDTLTPGDQGETAADRETTRSIRRALVQSQLSITAKNIKIITVNGHVTLRGPVNSADEQKTIEDLAKNAASGASVDNQLEVKIQQQ